MTANNLISVMLDKCNIYYEEIAEQLRGMGLENPVEYFNDEYLPFGRDWRGERADQ